MLHIAHSHEEGTLIDGTAKGDGTAPILKANAWRWSSGLGSWYFPNSRDRFAKLHQIEATASALRSAGFAVEIEIDDNPRDAVTTEAARQERATARIASLSARKDRKAAIARSAADRLDTISQTLPPFGQPILMDHYSGPRMLRKAEKFRNAADRDMSARAAAGEAARRVETAEQTMEFRETPTVVANRITRLTAEVARLQRQISGHERTLYTVGEVKHTEVTPPATGAYKERLKLMLKVATEQLAHWSGIRQQQIANGEANDYGPESISKGDYVCQGKTWHVVRRANAKTVSVPASYNPAKTETIAYTDLTGHKPAPQ